MEDIKTLWQMLQNIVEKEEKRYSLFDFLVKSTDEERKGINDKLMDEDRKQFFEFMDTYTFVNGDEVYMACCQYYEKTIDRGISMWECGDMSEVADDYIRERWLNFDD